MRPQPRYQRSSCLFLTGLLAGLSLTACGGGGGGSSQPPALKAQAEITFPGAGSMVDAQEITVRGVVRNGQNIAAVRVNGFGATSSDGFATWTASVPLSPDDKTLTVEVQDAGGAVQKGATKVDVRRGKSLLSSPWDLAWDASTGTLDVWDQNQTAMLRLNAQGRTRSLYTAKKDAFGKYSRQILFALDSANDRWLIADVRNRRLIERNRTTGVEKLISDNNRGSGTTFVSIADVAFDSTKSRALIFDRRRGLLAVDLSNGNRTVIRSYNTTFFSSVRRMVFDGTGNRVLLTDSGKDAVLAIRLSNGAVTTLSGPKQKGPPFSYPFGITLGGSNTIGFVGDGITDAIYLVNLVTGEREIIANDTIGSGPDFELPVDLAFDLAGERLLVSDSSLSRVLAVDLKTLSRGNRITIADGELGTGPSLRSGIDLVTSSGRTFVSNSEGVVAVDNATGDRAWLARRSNNVGSGPEIQQPRGVAWDSTNNKLLVADRAQGALVSIDAATGARSVVSRDPKNSGGNNQQEVGAGPSLLRAIGVAYDAAGKQALVWNSNRQLLTVDIGSGARKVLWASEKAGIYISSVSTGLVVDATAGRALIEDRSGRRIVAVDMASGKASVLAETGTGSDSFQPAGIAVTNDGRIASHGGQSIGLVEIDRASRAREIVSSANVGRGPLNGYSSMVTAAERIGQVLVLDPLARAIFLVDMSSGDRVVVSHWASTK